MSAQIPSPPPTFGQRLFDAFMRLLRALLLLIVLAAFGAFLFWSLPRLYNAFVLPVQEHGVRIEDLQAQQDQLAAQLTEQNTALMARIQELEAARDADKQTIAELSARLETLNADLSALSAAQQAAEGQLETYQQSLSALQSDLDALDAQLTTLQADLQTAQESLTLMGDYLASQDAPVTVLYREVQMVKAMELLTRSRIFLVRNDMGKARQDVQDAYDLLAELRPLTYGEQQAALEDILTRLDLVLQDFTRNPALLQDDMESAWRLLLDGLPGNSLPAAGSLQIVVTPSVEISATLGFPPEPGETITGTESITVTLTPEPTAAP